MAHLTRLRHESHSAPPKRQRTILCLSVCLALFGFCCISCVSLIFLSDINVAAHGSDLSPVAVTPHRKMPSPELATPLASTSEGDEQSSRHINSPGYPTHSLNSPLFSSKNITSSLTSRSLDTNALSSRTIDSPFAAKGMDSPPAFPPRGMDMPYPHRLLQDLPHGYSNYSGNSFPPSSGAYGPPGMSFGSLGPSFTPSSFAPSLQSGASGFTSSGATGSPPLEAFVQLLLAMNVEDQLKVGIYIVRLSQ